MRIFTNDGNDTLLGDIGPIAEHVRVSTRLPGGFAECSFRVPHETFIVPFYAIPNGRLDIADERGLFGSGRIERFEAADDGYWQFTARGYGINGDDQLYTAQDVSNTALETIVTNVVSSLMPQIGATAIATSGVTLSNATAINLSMMKGGQVLGWVSLIGTSANAPLQWHVYPDYDRTIRLTFETRPTTTSLRLSVRELSSYRFGFDMATFANRIDVLYNAGASVVTVNDTTLQGAGPAGVNLIRSRGFVYDELTQSADATQLANALLARLSAKRMFATSLTVNADAIPTDENDTPVPLWRVRSGKLCQLTDITAAGGNEALTFNNSFVIAGTEYDEDSGMLTTTPESYESYQQLEVARARQLLEGRHTVRT